MSNEFFCASGEPRSIAVTRAISRVFVTIADMGADDIAVELSPDDARDLAMGILEAAGAARLAEQLAKIQQGNES